MRCYCGTESNEFPCANCKPIDEPKKSLGEQLANRVVEQFEQAYPSKPTDEPVKPMEFVKPTIFYDGTYLEIEYLGKTMTPEEYIEIATTIITTQAERIDELNQGIIDRDSAVFKKIRELTALQKFARHVIRQECWGVYDELDGLEIQDLAEKLGLIAKHTATKEDIDEDSGYEVGDIIYKFTDVLKENEGWK